MQRVSEARVDVCCRHRSGNAKNIASAPWKGQSLPESGSRGWQSPPMVCVWMMIVYAGNAHHSLLPSAVYGLETASGRACYHWDQLNCLLVRLCAITPPSCLPFMSPFLVQLMWQAHLPVQLELNKHTALPGYCSVSIWEPRPPNPRFLCQCICHFFSALIPS